jgi:hypothetical protein
MAAINRNGGSESLERRLHLATSDLSEGALKAMLEVQGQKGR